MKMDEVTTRMLYKAVRYLWEVEKEMQTVASDRERACMSVEDKDYMREETALLDKALAELEYVQVAIACIDAEFTRRVQDDK